MERIERLRQALRDLPPSSRPNDIVEPLREAWTEQLSILQNLPPPPPRLSDFRSARERRLKSKRFKALCDLSLRWQRRMTGG